MRYLNLGCGQRYDPEWTNVDFVSNSKYIAAANLTLGIPFVQESFNVVYHSHLLEHFEKKQAKVFLTECHRVLSPLGVLRVVVPDLEQIVRCYLRKLDEVLIEREVDSFDYDWMLLELFDQIVRDSPGGEMGQLFASDDVPNQAFILERVGLEAQRVIDAKKLKNNSEKSQNLEVLKNIFRQLRAWGYGRNLVLRLLLGKKDYQALEIGRFRQSGEVHKWMYDRYSLCRLLEECGFVDVKQCAADESRIPNWTDFNLDTEPDGSVYKPDSLYMEATKLA